MAFIVYCARNQFTEKLYIGSTIQGLAERRCKHESKALNDWVDRPLYRDIRRLGKDSFEWTEIMRCGSKEEMLEVEAEIIDLLDTHKSGYNVAPDGACNRGGKHSKATRAKFAEARRLWWKSNPNATTVVPGFKHRSRANRELILAERAAGKSYREIGRLVGLKPESVCQAIARWKTNG